MLIGSDWCWLTPINFDVAADDDSDNAVDAADAGE